MMKKILYFLPFVLGCALYVFLGIVSSFGSINPFVWIALVMLLVAGLLMKNNKWYFFNNLSCFLISHIY